MATWSLHITDDISPHYSAPSTLLMISLHIIPHPPHYGKISLQITDDSPPHYLKIPFRTLHTTDDTPPHYWKIALPITAYPPHYWKIAFHITEHPPRYCKSYWTSSTILCRHYLGFFGHSCFLFNIKGLCNGPASLEINQHLRIWTMRIENTKSQKGYLNWHNARNNWNVDTNLSAVMDKF